MAKRLPHFAVSGERVPKGDLVFSHTTPADVVCFVILEINPNLDAFTVSLAWNSRSDELPRLLGMAPTDAAHQGAMRFPLPLLFDESARQDPWFWKIVEAPRIEDTAAWLADAPPNEHLWARASSLAEDALQRLETAGLEYFSGVSPARPADPEGRLGR